MNCSCCGKPLNTYVQPPLMAHMKPHEMGECKNPNCDLYDYTAELCDLVDVPPEKVAEISGRVTA